MPKLVTTDGEPRVLVRSAFDVLDREALVRLLDGSEEMSWNATARARTGIGSSSARRGGG
jgi:hypothetical protein